jgi:hypothetical protein
MWLPSVLYLHKLWRTSKKESQCNVVLSIFILERSVCFHTYFLSLSSTFESILPKCFLFLLCGKRNETCFFKSQKQWDVTGWLLQYSLRYFGWNCILWFSRKLCLFSLKIDIYSMITVPSFEKCQLSKREPYWTRQRAVVIGN